jgi:hypothetical protein
VRYIQPYGIPDLDAPYINGNPSIGLAGSIPPAAAFEHPMREIVHMIEKSGLAPSEADLHQLLKAIRTQKVNFAIDTGTTNHLVCSFDPSLDAYNNGFVVRIKVAHTNTGESEIDCGPGFRDIVRVDGSPLTAGDMSAGGIAKLVYVDNKFQLLNPNIAAAIQAAVSGGSPPVSGGGGNVVNYITNQFNGFQGIAAWEVAGTFDWPVPAGVLKVWLRLWAGGGPGVEWSASGSGTISNCVSLFNFTGGGIGCEGNFIKGGDGGYVEGMFPVVPGTLMRVAIGAGAPPPVTPSTGNILYNAVNWKNTFGQQSTFGPATGPAVCSCTGGRGCFPDPPGDTDPSPGRPGVGTGGVINRSNGIYGRGGGDGQSSDGVFDDYIECTGESGAAILIW